MPHRPFRRPVNQSITIRIDDDLLAKVDILAITLNRSRADMVRQMIVNAQLTGKKDVNVDIPVASLAG
jgi:predicted transcriptional regulator